MKNKLCLILAPLFLLGTLSLAYGMKEDDNDSHKINKTYNSVENKYDEYENILRKIEEGEKSVTGMPGKDVIIVLGRTQVGKSTTINALLGAKMQKECDGYIIEKDSEIKFAEMGGEGLSCTRLPRLYTSSENNFAFLDTRGFYDTIKEPAEEIAASILTEIAVKKAKSVRIMFIEDLAYLDKGAASFREMGQTLQKIVVGRKIPILLLFNRYKLDVSLSNKEKARKFLIAPFEEQEQIIEEAIIKGIDKTLEGEEKIISKIAGKISEKLGLDKLWKGVVTLFSTKSDTSPNELLDEKIREDDEFQKALEDTRYTSFLEFNKQKGNIAHIEPECDDSKKSVWKRLKNLDEIKQGSLVFNGYNDARIEFDKIFENEVSKLLLLVKAKINVLKHYNIETLGELEKEAKECLDYHSKILNSLKSEKLKLDLELMENSYSVPTEERNERLTVWENDNRRHSKKIETLEEKNKELLKGPPILYWKHPWNEESGFFKGWWRNYTCIYPHNIKFVWWKEKLGSETERKEIIKGPPPRTKTNEPHIDLMVKYTSSLGSDCEGTVKVYIDPKDDPSTIKLIEANQNDIESFNVKISKTKEKIKKLTMEQINGIEDKVSSKIRIFEERVSWLQKTINVRTKIDEYYNKESKRIELCMKLAEKLQTKKAIVTEFVNKYKKIKDRVVKIDNRFIDKMFGNYLLDPMLLLCRGEHGCIYERRSIAKLLEENNSECPHCRQTTNKLVPSGSDLLDIIDNIYKKTLSANTFISLYEQKLKK